MAEDKRQYLINNDYSSLQDDQNSIVFQNFIDRDRTMNYSDNESQGLKSIENVYLLMSIIGHQNKFTYNNLVFYYYFICTLDSYITMN